MLSEEKQAWLALAAVIAMGVFYFAGIVRLSGINAEQPDPYQWRSFVTYLIMFAAVMHVIIFLWCEQKTEHDAQTTQSISLAKLESSHYAYYTAVCGIISCVAWFYSPELLNAQVYTLVHILMAMLLLVLLVKYGSYIYFLRKL